MANLLLQQDIWLCHSVDYNQILWFTILMLSHKYQSRSSPLNILSKCVVHLPVSLGTNTLLSYAPVSNSCSISPLATRSHVPHPLETTVFCVLSFSILEGDYISSVSTRGIMNNSAIYSSSNLHAIRTLVPQNYMNSVKRSR
jgi:hypothetical protein